jgi:hypothetical protein
MGKMPGATSAIAGGTARCLKAVPGDPCLLADESRQVPEGMRKPPGAPSARSGWE